MTISPDARTPSATVHDLSGFTPPGAGATMQPFGVATMPAANAGDTFVPLGAIAAHPDAAVIDLAERVKALAARDHRVWDRLATAEDAIDEEMPPRPECGKLDPPTVNENWHSDGSRGPLFDSPDFGRRALDADAEHCAALVAHERTWNETAASRGLPKLEELATRLSRRLRRWAVRLTALAPQTQAGIAAKAAAALAVSEGGFSADWTDALMAAVGRDALRIATGLADGDPIIAMHRRARELYAHAENDATPNEEAMAALDQMNALVLAGPAVPPSTPAGALAALEWGREQLVQMMEQRTAYTPWDKAIVSVLDGALAVFKGLFERNSAASVEPSSSDDALAEAVAEFHRIDALQLVLCARHHRDCEDIPGYAETEAPWRSALERVADLPAQGWAGLVAKAAVLKTRTVHADLAATDDIGNSIVEDILRIAGRTWDERSARVPRPDEQTIGERAA